MNDRVPPTGGRERPVLLFVVNVAWFFRMHRLHLAQAARDAGFEVHVATAPDTPADVDAIKAAGFVHHRLELHRGRWGLIEEWRLTRTLFHLNRQLRPAIVHQVTIKPVICGTLAARAAGTRGIVNAMSGLGFVFTSTDRWAGVRRLVVKTVYRLLFASARVRVIFENSDDLQHFIDDRVVTSRRACLVRGAGVDLSRFRRRAPAGESPALVVLPARMLWDKGVREFCEAAALLRVQGINARFVLVGGLDHGNPAAIDESWLKEQVSGGTVEWWGHQDDMTSVYERALIVCLPSYREGLPTVLLEAAASGCALVTTNVPGCREVVQDSETGLLVEPRNVFGLASALRRMLEDASLRLKLIETARARVAAHFSVSRVQQDTLQLYRGLLNGTQ